MIYESQLTVFNWRLTGECVSWEQFKSCHWYLKMFCFRPLMVSSIRESNLVSFSEISLGSFPSRTESWYRCASSSHQGSPDSGLSRIYWSPCTFRNLSFRYFSSHLQLLSPAYRFAASSDWIPTISGVGSRIYACFVYWFFNSSRVWNTGLAARYFPSGAASYSRDECSGLEHGKSI